MRVSRLFLYASATLYLLAGIGLASFAYSVALGTSNVASRALIPLSVLLGLGVLAVLIIPTAITGCCGGHRQQRKFLWVFLVLLFLCLGLQIGVGFLATMSNAYARADVTAYWNQAKNTKEAADIQAYYDCCITTNSSTPADNPFAPPCADCLTTLIEYRINLSNTFAYMLWGGASLCAFAILADIAYLATVKHDKIQSTHPAPKSVADALEQARREEAMGQATVFVPLTPVPSKPC